MAFLKHIFFSLSVFLWCANVNHTFAQYSDSITHYIGYNSTGNYNRTNTSRAYLLSNGLRLGIKKKDLALNSTNKWLYGEQQSVLTNNDVTSTWDVNLYKTFPHFYYWGLLNYNSLYSLKINNQLQAGAGIAYNVIDRKNIQFNISDGLIYDYSDLILSDTLNEVYGTTRNSLRLQLKWNIRDRVKLTGIGFLQNSLQYGNDYIIKSDISLSFKIHKWLSFTSTFTYNSMSRTQRENLFMTYGLTAEKFF